MADKTVDELPQLTNANFTDGDYFLVWDESNNTSCKFSVSQYRFDVLAFGLTGGNYNGTLDANLNSNIVLPSPSNGDWFFVDVAGTIEGLDVDVHDIVKYNGTSWERVPRGIAVAANSRQTLLSTQTAIAGGAEVGTADEGGAPGWYYKNTTNGKINWYFYGGTGTFTDTNFGNLATMWAVVQVVEGYFYFQAYTKPTGSGDASWYKSRINWDDDSGQLIQNLPDGRYLFYTGNAEHTAAVHPEIANAQRIQVPQSTATTAGTAGAGEDIWLLALSTSSGFGEGHNEFTVEEFGYQFGTQKHTMDLVGVKPDVAETDPLFNASFKGNFPNTGALPAATAGQWAINDDTDSIFIYDGDTSAWVEAKGADAAPVADVPYVYSYGDDNGTQTGYGWMNADSAIWDALPNGNLQANGGSFKPTDATVKFATLKSAGDAVTLQGVDFESFGSYYYRAAFFYAQGGYAVDFEDYTYTDVGSGYDYYVEGSADTTKVFGHNCYVRPYIGTSSYASGMTPVTPGSNYTPADLTNVDLTWRIADMGAGDLRLEMLVDGVIICRSLRALVDGFSTNGLDIYILSKKHQVWPQPSGAAVNDPNPPVGDTWPGPHTTGVDFDSVNNRIRIPGAAINNQAYHPDDNSAFSVSAQLQFDGSISKRYPLYTTAEMSFDISSTSYYGYMQTFSYDNVWNTGSDVWYDTYDKAYNGSVNAMTYTWTGKDAGVLPRHGSFGTSASQLWMRTDLKGFYDESTKIFTPDENGAYLWQYAKYPGNSWSLGMNVNGNWTRFLSNWNALNSGGANVYNQTIINSPEYGAGANSLIDGERFPHGHINATSGWTVHINGEHLASKTVTGNNPVNFLGGSTDAFIGMRSYDATFTNTFYGGGTSMNEWALTSPLEGDAIATMHTAMNTAVDLRTWLGTVDGATMRLYYPMADDLSTGVIKDYSGNGFDATIEGID
jgi:hypothetical protein